MKSTYIYIIFFFLLTNPLGIISAQYNITLNGSLESSEPTEKNSNNVIITPLNSKSIYNFDDIDEGSITLESNNSYPTYTDVFKVAKTPMSNFLFTATQTNFPYEINQFVRKQIIVSKTNNGKITAVYKSSGALNNRSTFTISLIPVGFGTEGRLRDAFDAQLAEFSKELDLNRKPSVKVSRFNGKSYKPLGLEAIYIDNNKSSGLIMYECGSWLMDIKIVNFNADSLNFQKFYNDLVQIFNPSRLTAVNPLYDRPNLDFNSEGLKDPLMTGALWASAMKKIAWASSEVTSRERATGFPDLYLNMHIEAVKEFLKVQANKPNLKPKSQAWSYYNDLLAINNAGFLPEYIMEQYNNVMIVPSNIHLNFEAYHQWKKDRDIQADIRKKLYNISYRNLPY